MVPFFYFSRAAGGFDYDEIIKSYFTDEAEAARMEDA